MNEARQEKVVSRAIHRGAKISPQKVRLVVDVIRGKPVETARQYLAHMNKKAAGLVKKVLDSAIANAENNDNLDVDELFVSKVHVDAGPSMRRFEARAKGSSNQIIKRSSHICVEVSEREG